VSKRKVEANPALAQTVLPPGWRWTSIGDMADVATGTTPRSGSDRYYKDGSIPWVTSTAVNKPFVDSGTRLVTQAALDESRLRLFPPNTLLIALYGEGQTRGKVSELRVAATINQALAAIQLRDESVLMRGFAKHYLDYRYLDLRRNSAGGVQPNLNLGLVRRTAIPLPPLAEQWRIVAKIEELFSELDAGVAALRRVQANLKRYRAAILNAAVTGKLTEEWRKQNPSTETADQLLARILDERRKKWEEDQLRKFAAAGKTPPKGWKSKYCPPQSERAANVMLPTTWIWASTEQITDNLDGQRVPVRSSDRAAREGRYPYYGASGIIDYVDGYLFRGDHLLIAEDGANLLSRSTPIAFKATGDFWVNNHAHVVRTFCDMPLSYVECFFNATNLQFWITGSAQPKLTQANLNRIPVPLPPLAEQQEIVAEVERRFTIVDAAEAEVEHSLKRAIRLRQSILKRAFEGRLVPADTPRAASVSNSTTLA
jgi:type I restriction enzyme, S subunit